MDQSKWNNQRWTKEWEKRKKKKNSYYLFSSEFCTESEISRNEFGQKKKKKRSSLYEGGGGRDRITSKS